MKLDDLNETQIMAIKETEGPVLVLAGAGSGKTRVLTTRVAYLIDELGIAPDSILAITFTNKAAKEMKDRILRMLGTIAYKIQISTFHSFGLSILKENYTILGYKKNFTIIDSDDSLTLIKKILKDMNKDPKIFNPKNIRNRISGAKNELLSPSEYVKFVNTEFEELVLDVYKRYQEKLLINNSVDFDDLLVLPITLFRTNPSILALYQERYKYILIDEYQDTNEAQYLLTKMISAKYKNICCVGDNDQSIYGFRGSNYKNIMNFEKDYEKAKVILLERNYRSTKNILDVANSVIKKNTLRKDKNLWTDNIEGSKVVYYRSENEMDEAHYVKKEIDKLKNTESLNEIAVLYRTNAQSRVMEDALLRDNIPYRIVGSIEFLKRKEIKDLVAYLNVIYNQNDDISVLRVINVPRRGIGDKTIENLTIKANKESKSLYDVIESGKELEFKKIIEDIKLNTSNMSLSELVDYVLERSSIKKDLISENTIESEVRLENLEEFKSITKNFEEERGIVSLGEFLVESSLLSDIGDYKLDTSKDYVTLMTVHAAKGLEFDYVFVIGMEEGIFPHMNSLDNFNDIEEERRLCYVAITRARKKLWLVNAKRRTIYGLDNINQVSRFIKEIDSELLDIGTDSGYNKLNKKQAIDLDVKYEVGDKVSHDKFGNGIVVSIDKTVISIAFPHPAGIKQFMKGHKSIKKI